MNILSFMAGCGVGILISGCLFLAVVCAAGSRSRKDAAFYNSETIRLLEDRNKINQSIADNLRS
jgi:hypothetical protein